MIEDLMDYDATQGTYREQPPLRAPPNLPSSSFHAAVSPRFDNLMSRSSSVPWSPAPLDPPRYDKPSYPDSFSQNNTYTKSVDMWSINNNNNNNNNSSNNNNNHNNYQYGTSRPPENWLNSSMPSKPSENWMNNSMQTRPNDFYNNSINIQQKTSEIWSPSTTNMQTKTMEVWGPTNGNSQNKTLDSWTTQTFTKTGDSLLTNNNKNNSQAQLNPEKKSGFITDRCSPRCKLGILGFTIGFLAVGIAVAVVLVLWLRG